MGAMKQIATKLQSGRGLNNDEKRFFKVFCTKPKLKKETAQLDLFEEQAMKCPKTCPIIKSGTPVGQSGQSGMITAGIA